MNRKVIKDYIITHQNDYSKESLVSRIKESGVSDEEINSVYAEIESEKNISLSKKEERMTPSEKIRDKPLNKKGKPGLALFLIILGIFIPVLGFAFIIGGIILGFKAKKVRENKGFPLFVIIFGFIALVLAGFIQLFIINMIFFSFVDFGSMMPAMVMFSNYNFQGNPALSTVADNIVTVVFTYTGSQRILFDPTKISFKNNNCLLNKFRNHDISVNSITEPISFRSGHGGFLQLDCSSANLKKGEMFEDTLEFHIKDSKTEVISLVTAEVRLPIIN